MTAIRQIHVGRRELGLDEDTYRGLLVRVTGKASLKLMSDAEHRRVIEDMRAKGFKPASKSSGTAVSGRYAKKAQALWIALWNLGAVDDRRDAAMIAFAKRQTGIDHIDWVRDAKSGRAVVEALKKIAERHGVDWSPSSDPDRDRHGYRVARAQLAKLGAPGGDFWVAVSKILRRAVITRKPTDREWMLVTNELGKKVRAQAEVSSG